MQLQEDSIEVLWMTFEVAIKKLSLEGEVQLAERVVEALEKNKATGIK